MKYVPVREKWWLAMSQHPRFITFQHKNASWAFLCSWPSPTLCGKCVFQFVTRNKLKSCPIGPFLKFGDAFRSDPRSAAHTRGYCLCSRPLLGKQSLYEFCRPDRKKHRWSWVPFVSLCCVRNLRLLSQTYMSTWSFMGERKNKRPCGFWKVTDAWQQFSCIVCCHRNTVDYR